MLNFPTFSKGQVCRPELAQAYTLPVYCYADHATQEMVYTTPHENPTGFMEIGRIPFGAAEMYSDFLEFEWALMERERPEDWSI